jgi:hypothetical protein
VAAGALDQDRVCRIGWQLYCDSERAEAARWGAVLDEAAELRAVGYITEPELRETADRELAAFERELSELPPWA